MCVVALGDTDIICFILLICEYSAHDSTFLWTLQF